MKNQSVPNSDLGFHSLLNFPQSSVGPDGSGTGESKDFLQGLGAQSPAWTRAAGATRQLFPRQGASVLNRQCLSSAAWEFFTCLHSSGHRSLPLDCWGSQTGIFLKVSKFVCCHLSFSVCVCACSLMILCNVQI